MKRETTQRKLLEALGLDPTQFETPEEPKVKKNKYGLPEGLTLEQYESYRGGQATAIFLQAPELFKAYVCKNCGEPFLVSRTLVAFCTYDCTRAALHKAGIEWEPFIDEEYLRRVWDNNEPLRVPPAAVKVLQQITQDQEGQPQNA